MDMNEREAYKLYKQGGQYLVYDYVNQGFLRYDKWGYCEPCECESPIYKSHCLVCSTQYKNNNTVFSSLEKHEMDIWCKGKCKTDEFGNFYNDGNKQVYKDRDGNRYKCSKHHYTCAECNLITQIG